MKKALYLALVLFGSVAMSSCRKTEVIENNFHTARSLWFQVASNQWVPNDARDFWSYSIDVPEIDQLIFENGTVLVDISFGDGIFEPLTTVYNGLAYRYDYTSDGNVLIDVTWADGGTGTIARPGDVTLKVILVDADPIN